MSKSRSRTQLPKSGQVSSKHRVAKSGLPWAWFGGGLLAVILVAGGILLSTRPAGSAVPGRHYPIQGQQHILPGESHPLYNSDPPTSGWHYDTPLTAGFHEEPAADEFLVHNLEHGHVVISYDCSKLASCQDTKARLQELMRGYRNWKITAVPRQNANAAIALTAWGWLDELDGFDEARIVAFIDAWRDRGPERTKD